MLLRTAPPADIPLPWDDRPQNANRGSVAGFRLDPSAVNRFNQLLHEVYPEARQVDVDRIASLGRWLQDLPADQAREVLDERLTRIELLRQLRDDPDWDEREGIGMRVRRLLAYLDDSEVIPDDIPVLGLLDDVILLELAWPAVKTEVDDYLDFCSFRESARPAGDGPQRREAWINDRLQALALFQHQNRINDSRYADSGQPRDIFRVR